MQNWMAALVLAVAALAASPAVAQDKKPGLAPSSQWVLDYADDSCAIRRLFGEGRDRGFVEFRRFQPSGPLQVIVASSRMRQRDPLAFEYSFNSDFGSGWVRGGSLAINMPDGFRGVLFQAYIPLDTANITEPIPPNFRFELQPRIESASAARLDTITVRNAFPSSLTLQLGSLEEPIAALNTCVDELITHWGIDVEAHKTLSQGVRATNMREVPRMMHYPPKMAAQRMPGLVHVRLMIDERGLQTDCHIQMPLSDPEFEKSSCADLEHALEFEPALDKDGKPMASYWATSVNFVAPTGY